MLINRFAVAALILACGVPKLGNRIPNNLTVSNTIPSQSRDGGTWTMFIPFLGSLFQGGGNELVKFSLSGATSDGEQRILMALAHKVGLLGCGLSSAKSTLLKLEMTHVEGKFGNFRHVTDNLFLGCIAAVKQKNREAQNVTLELLFTTPVNTVSNSTQIVAFIIPKPDLSLIVSSRSGGQAYHVTVEITQINGCTLHNPVPLEKTLAFFRRNATGHPYGIMSGTDLLNILGVGGTLHHRSCEDQHFFIISSGELFGGRNFCKKNKDSGCFGVVSFPERDKVFCNKEVFRACFEKFPDLLQEIMIAK